MRILFLAILSFIIIGVLFLKSSPLYVLVIIASVMFFAISFSSPEMGLMVILVAMLFSPEYHLAQLPKRSIVLRIEDIFIVILFISWFVRMGVDKTLPFIKSSPVNKPLLFFIVINFIAAIKGALLGNVSLFRSLFFTAKYLEYFILFFMVRNYLREKRQMYFYFAVIVCVFIGVTIYGYTQIGTGMVSTPFEGVNKEPATYGGYILLVGFVIASVAWHIKRMWMRIVLGSIFLAAIPPFLHSLSRASYLGAIPAFLTFWVLTKEKKRSLTFLCIGVIFIGCFYMPNFVIERVKTTFVGEERPILNQPVQLEESSAARIQRWRDMLYQKWPRQPLLGYGPGAMFIDGQYVTTLMEGGFLGLFGFVWCIMAIFMMCFEHLKTFQDDRFISGLIVGFLSGTVGILVHSLTTNTFIIIRVMEPFWFLAGMIAALQNISREV